MAAIRRFILRIQAFYSMLGFFFADPKFLQERLAWLKDELGKINLTVNTTNREKLFGTVGRALTSWSKMEEILVAIVTILLRTPPEKAGVLMYSILNFNNWLQVIDDLFVLDQKFGHYRDAFNKIRERIRRVKDFRDRLAHHSVRMDSGEEAPLITPSKFDARSKSKQQAPLTLGEVVDFTNNVLAIAQDLQRLLDAMRAEGGSAANSSTLT